MPHKPQMNSLRRHFRQLYDDVVDDDVVDNAVVADAKPEKALPHNQLDVVACGTVCRRLVVVSSAIDLAAEAGYSLQIFWPTGAECRTPFSDLFELADAPDVSVTAVSQRDNLHRLPGLGNLYAPFWSRLSHEEVTRYMVDPDACGPGCRLLSALTSDMFLSLTDGPAAVRGLRAGRNIVFTCQPLTKSYDVPGHIRPKAYLDMLIGGVTAHFVPNMVGVHIRQRSRHLGRKGTPLYLFVHAMDEEIMRHGDVRFFLATDSEDVKRRLKSLYGERVVTYDAVLRPHSDKGVKDAVVELYCLSRCRSILLNGSSFGRLAAAIGHLPMTLIKEEL
jgi:hypothetical protein